MAQHTGDDRQDRDVRFRRGLRRGQTPVESQLWSLLRGRAVLGAKFQQQAPICGWVVDFSRISRKLVVEMDGAFHDEPEQAARDLARDACLRECGWTVLRFRNHDALGTPTPALSRPAAGEGWEMP
jgi:uroporphyrinogen-III synthase